jgi:hypothetical protein
MFQKLCPKTSGKKLNNFSKFRQQTYSHENMHLKLQYVAFVIFINHFMFIHYLKLGCAIAVLSIHPLLTTLNTHLIRMRLKS